MGAFEELGFEVVEKSERSMVYVEMGGIALVDGLPGVPDGSRYLGTFDRREALEKEEAEFFASGHPLVEGLLLELEDGARGRAALVEIDAPGIRGAGLALVYKHGPHWSLEIVEANGAPRPEWREPLLAALPRAHSPKPEKWGLGGGWATGIRELARTAIEARGDAPGELVAAAFFRSSA
jgi:hypothetical protein